MTAVDKGALEIACAGGRSIERGNSGIAGSHKSMIYVEPVVIIAGGLSRRVYGVGVRPNAAGRIGGCMESARDLPPPWVI